MAARERSPEYYDDILREAVTEAAAEGLRVYKEADDGLESAPKEDETSVTAADFAANDTMMGILGPTGIPISSEETKPRPPLVPGRVWVVDPIDGSKYLENPDNEDSVAAMAGLLEDGVVKVAALCILGTREVFAAGLGRGAWKSVDGSTPERLPKLPETQLQNGLHVLVGSHVPNEIRAMQKELGLEEKKFGGLGIKVARMAEGTGHLHARDKRPPKPHDTVIKLIGEEVGVIVSDLRGRPFSYDNITKDNRHPGDGLVIASSRAIHRAVLGRFEHRWAA